MVNHNHYVEWGAQHLAKKLSNKFESISFLPLLQPEVTISISFIPKAELIGQIFAKNFTLDDSVLVSPSPLPSNYCKLPIKILCNGVFHTLTGLNPR